jgi:hypothetical protein
MPGDSYTINTRQGNPDELDVLVYDDGNSSTSAPRFPGPHRR